MNPADELREWEQLVGATLSLQWNSGGQMFGTIGRLYYAKMSSNGVVLHLETGSGPVDISSSTIVDGHMMEPPEKWAEHQMLVSGHLKRLLDKPRGEGLVSRPGGPVGLGATLEELQRFTKLGPLFGTEQREFSIGLAFMLEGCPHYEDNWPK